MKCLMDIFVSLAIVAQTAIVSIAKTVASGLFICQETTLSHVYFYAALNRLTKLVCKVFDNSLLHVLQCLLLSRQVNNKYIMTGHIVQGGVV
jgi:hypothetical protein